MEYIKNETQYSKKMHVICKTYKKEQWRKIIFEIKTDDE